MALIRTGGGAAQLNDIQKTGAFFGRNGTTPVATNIDASLSYVANMDNFSFILICNGEYATVSGSGSDAYNYIKYNTDGTVQYVSGVSGSQNISGCQAIMLFGTATVASFSVTKA